jgi:hypothetical protein
MWAKHDETRYRDDVHQRNGDTDVRTSAFAVDTQLTPTSQYGDILAGGADRACPQRAEAGSGRPVVAARANSALLFAANA